MIRPAARPQLRHKALRSILALILREMTTTYGRSPGGYFWAVAQPVAMIVILALAFSLLLRSPPLGSNFILFYATGILPLRLFQMLSNNVGGAVAFSKPLLAYPRVTLADALIARAILTVLTQFVVAIVILTGIYMFVDSTDRLSFDAILLAYGLTVLLGIGVGAFNCFLFTLLPVWKIIWGIATGPLIILSAVIYIFEELPLFAQQYLWFNPLVHITGIMRSGFYSTYHPTYPDLAYVLTWALVPAFFGLLLLRRYGRTILYL
jgi:capsular polysaccharide transport system permease protein